MNNHKKIFSFDNAFAKARIFSMVIDVKSEVISRAVKKREKKKVHLCCGCDYPRHFTLEPERVKREKKVHKCRVV